MNTTTRQNEIINLLKEHGSVDVNELSRLFSVSTVTIRKDLKYLELQGLLFRLHGSAVLNKTFVAERSFLDKKNINTQTKKRIAQRAAEFVSDGDRIIIDSGSTTDQLAFYLQNKKNLTVYTNALNIAYELSFNESINVIVAGGEVRHMSFSILGDFSDTYIRNFHFNKFFLGVDGLDLDVGITTTNLAEARINRLMCESSDEVILLVDSSKFGLKGFCPIVKLHEIRNLKCIITDEQVPQIYLDEFDKMNIDIVLIKNEDNEENDE